MFTFAKRKNLSLISLLVAGCFMMTSCGLLPGKSNKAGKEIESVVSDYLDAIADGDFADDSYESDLAADTPFADLKFSDEGAEDLMKFAFEKITYEIDSSEGDQKDGEGSCDVVLTTIDLDAVIDSLEEDFDAEILKAAIDDKAAPTEDHEITLDLEFDDDEEEWLISDTSELSEILGEPFAALELSIASDPVKVATDFLEALKAGDFDIVSVMSDGYFVEDDFIDPVYSGSAELFDAVLGEMTYEITETETSTDTEISFGIDYWYPDYPSALDRVSSDVQTMSDLVKPYVDAMVNEGTGPAEPEYIDYLNSFGKLVVAEFQNSNNNYASSGTISLFYDDISEAWYVEFIPYDFCQFSDMEFNIDPMNKMDETVFDEIILNAFDELLESGSITQAQYDEYFPSATYDSATVLASITNQGWYDYNTEGYVTAYPIGVNSLNYDVFFSRDFSGLNLNCEFFGTNGTVSLWQYTVTLDNGMSSYYFYYANEDESALAADTYRVVISTTDGTVLADSSITVG